MSVLFLDGILQNAYSNIIGIVHCLKNYDKKWI